MSRTMDFLTTEKPKRFPFETSARMEVSVCGISLTDEQDNPNKLRFVIGPTFLGVPIIRRRLVFSLEKSPKLNFDYIEAGDEEIDGNKVYLLLEKN